MPEPPPRPRPKQKPKPSDFLPPTSGIGKAKSDDVEPKKRAKPEGVAPAQPVDAAVPEGMRMASSGPPTPKPTPRRAEPLQATPLTSAPRKATPLMAAPLQEPTPAATVATPAAPVAAVASPAPSQSFVVNGNASSPSQRYKGRKSGVGALLIMAACGMLGVGALIGGGFYLISQSAQGQQDELVADNTTSTEGNGSTAAKTDKVDASTTPGETDEHQPPGNAAKPLPVVAQQDVAPAVAELLRAKGLPATLKNARMEYADGRYLREVDVEGKTVQVLQFGSATAAARAMADLDGVLSDFGHQGRVYRHESALVLFDGSEPRVISQLTLALGEPLRAPPATTVAANNSFDRPDDPASTLPLPTTPGSPPTTTGPTDQATAGATTTSPPAAETSEAEAAENEQILKLFDDKQLTSTKNYETLRNIYASRFERAHQNEIGAAFDDELKQWLEEHVEIKQEFFTAVKPDDDNVARVLAQFAELWKAHREDFADNWNAAVAVAVTWDGGRGSIEDYVRHQRRCSAILPNDLIGAGENFSYLVGTDSARYLPWEFLCYVVNHRTPLTERQWAVSNYMPRRQMIGKIYSDVEYDTVMLRTSSKVCRLNGQDYTLPNILKFGGVCAMQADFASRVAKSLGIPAAYVRGESNSGDYHAWVEWVVLTHVGPNKINFSLESHGRYRGDKYYVGTLYHPQTGGLTTDRQMELELHTVGMDRVAKRHAELVMKSWPMIRQQREMSVGQQFAFLAEVARLCPGNTDAWLGMAAINKSGNVDGKDRRMAVKMLDELFRTYANFPDFTWEVFDDMIGFEPELKKRIALYQRLVAMYVKAQRADLATKAQLKLTDMLLEDEQVEVAGNGLIQMLMAFADDGRNVRPALEKLEELCGSHGEQGAAILDVFWKNFLPRVPKTRGGTPTEHAHQMHRRALLWYQRRGNAAAVQFVQQEIAKMQAGG